MGQIGQSIGKMGRPTGTKGKPIGKMSQSSLSHTYIYIYIYKQIPSYEIDMGGRPAMPHHAALAGRPDRFLSMGPRPVVRRLGLISRRLIQRTRGSKIYMIICQSALTNGYASDLQAQQRTLSSRTNWFGHWIGWSSPMYPKKHQYLFSHTGHSL